ASTEQTGLKIILRATSQLENNTRAKEAFIRAAAYWESIITSPITVIIDVDYGPTRFGVPYPNANVIGSTSSQTLGTSTLYTSMRSRLIERAANAQQSQIFNRLPALSLPTELGTTTSVFVSSAILRALGFIAPTADPATETNYGPLPSIGFNSNFPFDFDPSNGIDFDKIDFHATAVHEIGHFLGFNSYVGQAELNPGLHSATIWDFFRFRPGMTIDSFNNTPRLQISGGDHSHFAGLGESALSTSRLDGQGGDGRQAPHWRDDTLTGRVLGIMDPTAATGIRDDISALDLQTLGHFGYGINPATAVTERLVLDDNSFETATVVPGALVVNRFTPTRYPAKVKGIM
ncbi:MAG: NF038122 family metalloprotease, partial [Acidobacteriota bacterium]